MKHTTDVKIASIGDGYAIVRAGTPLFPSHMEARLWASRRCNDCAEQACETTTDGVYLCQECFDSIDVDDEPPTPEVQP